MLIVLAGPIPLHFSHCSTNLAVVLVGYWYQNTVFNNFDNFHVVSMGCQYNPNSQSLVD